MSGIAALVLSAGIVLTGTAQETHDLRDDIKTALQNESYIYVATQRLTGEWSTSAPVWFMYDGDAIYFTTSPKSHKAHRIYRGSPVRVWIGQKDGPLLEGDARFIRDRAIVERMATSYKQKYWIARLGFFQPRPKRVVAGKTLAVKVAPLRVVPQP